ncbi:DegV family protein [Ligilactobacillus salitolerans]|uniref:DegV family protein n=1 Tax=Ligilactobacillus salitolerans TaxID=1808352 RepID=A0A401IQD2_9LACO|nr:DegV family protein [Ligilactobacillus salitolerans]GBG93741.1 DegV family protein [Ligilactobacillus salitolerans]
MKIAVVTDSASCLTPDETKKYRIKVIPITVIFERRTYLENVDITAADFYQKMKEESTLPSTAQITPGQMQEAYDELAADGYDAVISIHLSSGITTFYENLVNYLPAVSNIKVYPFDSRLASTAEGAMAKLAVRLIDAGYTPEDIIKELEKFRETTEAYLAVDDLSHLVRTGRLSNASGFVGSILRIKPVLTFTKEGKILALEKERTMKRAHAQIKQKFAAALSKADYPVRLTVINADAPTMEQQWADDAKQSYPEVLVEKSDIGPVIGVHVGAGTMAFLWCYDWEQWPIDPAKQKAE